MMGTIKVKHVNALDQEVWENIFSSKLGKRLRLHSKEIKPLDNLNDAFNSNIVKACLEFRNEDENNEDIFTFNVFIKSPRTSYFQRLLGRYKKPFMVEGFCYDRMPKIFPELSHMLPECYYSYASKSKILFNRPRSEKLCCFPFWILCAKSEKGLLILEDLTNPSKVKQMVSFKVLDKTKVPSLAHIKMALTHLAHFHGVWFKFLHKIGPQRSQAEFSPEEFLKAFSNSNDTILLRGFMDLFNSTLEAIIMLLRNREESEEFVQKVEKFKRKVLFKKFKRFFQDFVINPSTPLFTFIHGDFWTNNMLFQEDNEGNPIGFKLIDFQMVVCSYPLYDLYYFFYAITDTEFRRNHETECLKVYFEVLEEYITPRIQMSFEEFVEEYNSNRIGCVLSAFCVMPNVLNPNSIALESVRDYLAYGEKHKQFIGSKDHQNDHPNAAIVRNRLVDLMHELDDFGILSEEALVEKIE